MFKFVLLVLFIVSISAPAKATFSLSDDVITYATFGIGLVIKNGLSHYSKKLALNHPTISVLLRCASDGTALFLLKETGEVVLQSFKDVAPDWLKPSKNKREEAKIAELQAELQKLKLLAVAPDNIAQAERIDVLKRDLLDSRLDTTLNKIEELLTCHGWISCPDESLTIANLLTQLTKNVLSIYPGFTSNDDNMTFLVNPNLKPGQTGESYIYNETLILEKAQNFRLGTRLSEKTLTFLKEDFKVLAKKQDYPQAKYIQHLYGLLGIELDLPEFTAKSNTGTQNPEL